MTAPRGARDEPLPESPACVADAQGRLLQGFFRGSVQTVDWRTLREPRLSPVERFARQKRWLYAAVATRAHFFGAAIVDVGYAANAFVFAVDLDASKTLVNRSALGVPGLMARVGPHPLEGAAARFRSPGFDLDISRPVGANAWELRSRFGRLGTAHLQIEVEGATPATYLGAVGGGGRANCTMKLACARVTGAIEIAGRSIDLHDAMGGLDFTCGLLPRKTRWRWAFLLGRADDGTRVGLNLVEGFNAPPAGGPSEDAAWIDGEPIALGRAKFEHDREAYLRPWRVTTRDGAVDLVFTPAAGYHDRRNLGVAKSSFLQVAGRYRGTLRVGDRLLQLTDLSGVAEDQDVVW
jgi:hypothetical protein